MACPRIRFRFRTKDTDSSLVKTEVANQVLPNPNITDYSSPLENHHMPSQNNIITANSNETAHNPLAGFEHAVSIQGACGKIVIKCRSNALQAPSTDIDALSSSLPGSPDLTRCNSEERLKSPVHHSQPLCSTSSASFESCQTVPPIQAHSHCSSLESNCSSQPSSDDMTESSHRQSECSSPPSQSGLKIRLKHTHRSPTDFTIAPSVDFAIGAAPPSDVCFNSTASPQNGAKRPRIDHPIDDYRPSIRLPIVNGDSQSHVSLHETSSSNHSAAALHLALEATQLEHHMNSATHITDVFSHSAMSSVHSAAFLDPPLFAESNICNAPESSPAPCTLESMTTPGPYSSIFASICAEPASSSDLLTNSKPNVAHELELDSSEKPAESPESSDPTKPQQNEHSDEEHNGNNVEPQPQPARRRKRRDGINGSVSVSVAQVRESRRSKLLALSFVHSITSSLTSRRRERSESDFLDLSIPAATTAPDHPVGCDAIQQTNSSDTAAPIVAPIPKKLKLSTCRSTVGPLKTNTRIRSIGARSRRLPASSEQQNELHELSPSLSNSKPLPRALRSRRSTPVPFFLPDVCPKQFTSLSSPPSKQKQQQQQLSQPADELIPERLESVIPLASEVTQVHAHEPSPLPPVPEQIAELRPSVDVEKTSRSRRGRPRRRQLSNGPEASAAPGGRLSAAPAALPEHLSDDQVNNVAHNLGHECEQLERVHAVAVSLMCALCPDLSPLVRAVSCTRLMRLLERCTRDLEEQGSTVRELEGGSAPAAAAPAPAAAPQVSLEPLAAALKSVAAEADGVGCSFGCHCAPAANTSKGSRSGSGSGSSELLEAALLFSGEESALCDCVCHRKRELNDVGVGVSANVAGGVIEGIPVAAVRRVSVELCRKPQRCALRLRVLLSRLLACLVPALEAASAEPNGRRRPLSLKHLEALLRRLTVTST